jgi:hypothetical protein
MRLFFGLGPSIVVNCVVDGAVISYVRNNVDGELFCKITHILLNVVNCHSDWLLDLRLKFFGLFHLGDRELKLSGVHNTVISHQFLPFLLSNYFCRGLF